MFLDTSGLLCMLDHSESFHESARTFYRAASARLTHNCVLVEFVALAHVRRVPRMDALTFVADLLDNPDINVIWVDEPLHREALALLFARTDKSYSLCDALSFILMRRHRLTEALTTDRHFEQEGFRRLLVGA